MKVYQIKEKPEYLKEILTLTQQEWGKKLSPKELNEKINHKIEKIKTIWNQNDYCKLILLNGKDLIGFISIFPSDSEERKDLTPWYATMYVKKEYRGHGYSKILHHAILKEAKKRGYKQIYLKTDLENYYEKLGARYLDMLNETEKLYCFDLEESLCLK